MKLVTSLSVSDFWSVSYEMSYFVIDICSLVFGLHYNFEHIARNHLIFYSVTRFYTVTITQVSIHVSVSYLSSGSDIYKIYDLIKTGLQVLDFGVQNKICKNNFRVHLQSGFEIHLPYG